MFVILQTVPHSYKQRVDMAAYDYGGGCPCGLYYECPKGCQHYVPKPENYSMTKLNENDDFGFSLVSEAELKSVEESLTQQVEETSTQMQAKLEGLVKMVMPLLDNLMQNPEKEYIYWPNRQEKIKAFKTKLQNYIK